MDFLIQSLVNIFNKIWLTTKNDEMQEEAGKVEN